MDHLAIMATAEGLSEMEIAQVVVIGTILAVLGFLGIKYARPLASLSYSEGSVREFQVWMSRLVGLLFLAGGVFFLGGLLYSLLFGEPW